MAHQQETKRKGTESMERYPGYARSSSKHGEYARRVLDTRVKTYPPGSGCQFCNEKCRECIFSSSHPRCASCAAAGRKCDMHAPTTPKKAHSQSGSEGSADWHEVSDQDEPSMSSDRPQRSTKTVDYSIASRLFSPDPASDESTIRANDTSRTSTRSKEATVQVPSVSRTPRNRIDEIAQPSPSHLLRSPGIDRERTPRPRLQSILGSASSWGDFSGNQQIGIVMGMLDSKDAGVEHAAAQYETLNGEVLELTERVVALEHALRDSRKEKAHWKEQKKAYDECHRKISALNAPESSLVAAQSDSIMLATDTQKP